MKNLLSLVVIIENQSGKQITFIPYSDGNMLLDKKVIPDNNKTLKKSYKEISLNL